MRNDTRYQSLGHRAHRFILEEETIAVNVSGFISIALVAFRHFERRGYGHLEASTSIAALRGPADATVYAASKAFQSVYLGGLCDTARQKKLPVTITERQHGFVDTQMLKTVTPLSPLVRNLLVSDTSNAARQMLRAISRKKNHVYITSRYTLFAWLLKLLPRPGS